ncbi:GNAT family N-acetyltransferase [Nakamurella aerolata]|uniref:GNAT family N-acetyltransferase n=1 Tax=Nakamurella aerolata TaxID=1656892 RepID=A0A849AAE7_9ACTN|nr:GNAT family N-acetyltransferase [Nakamurella aerolata]NNG36091.1 GNAT family N-acetyltransferase [Nakamurella aerolata]
MTAPSAELRIDLDDPLRADVLGLLTEHLADMHATSPACSVHALQPEALVGDGMVFLSARRAGVLLGIGALKRLSADHGELKSMRTTAAARGQGVAAAVLTRLLAQAAAAGMTRVSLETGAQDYFGAARRLYRRAGFVECAPFGDYRPDPNSVFFTRPVG